MKKKALLLYILSLLFGVFIQSCTNCGPFPDKYKTTDFQVVLKQITNLDSPMESLQEISNNTLVYNHLAISFESNYQTYFSASFSTLSQLSVLSSATACSPVIPGTDETVEDIQIFCNKSFSEAYPENTDLKALFDIAYFDNHQYTVSSLTDFIALKPKVPIHFLLILRGAPQVADTYNFTIQYHQNGVEMDDFEYTTDVVFLELE